ncbi:hypothetical protein JTE90_015176 [Oedothorax gibbosus]|uniref:Uncharacterized protein n=1 Tax=Oedothorax gibbosus TaxID=931172 RepID=A0AAV6VA61_9ARAC|nr:hypothetical protein JTE90_015176 [Oedothorax gibbosus]
MGFEGLYHSTSHLAITHNTPSNQEGLHKAHPGGIVKGSFHQAGGTTSHPASKGQDLDARQQLSPYSLTQNFEGMGRYCE